MLQCLRLHQMLVQMQQELHQMLALMTQSWEQRPQRLQVSQTSQSSVRAQVFIFGPESLCFATAVSL